jgi:hypothetical protein
MLKTAGIIFALLFNASLFSQDKITVETAGIKPTVGEGFTLEFHIESDEDGEPQLSFTPVNATVLGQEFLGSSMSTVYSNGKLTTKNEKIVGVTLSAKAEGRMGLTGIKAEINGKVIRMDSVWLNAYVTPPEAVPLFILAVPSKKRVYKNEAILLRYYVYTKVNVGNQDIKEYPKLNHFMKRYLQESSDPERVEYNGDIYVRSLLYSSILYPEVVQKLVIDPLKVNVTYFTGRPDPFGLGMGSGRQINKLLTSTPINVEVLGLPAANLKPGFTGLVGKHQVEFQLNKTKVLVNEPIEATLKITGPGNLEAMEAPTLISDPNIESFESNSQFEPGSGVQSSRTFQLTFLPRTAVKLPAKNVPITFFNPESGEYESVQVSIPAIEVVGGVFQGGSSQSTQTADPKVDGFLQPSQEFKPAVITTAPFAGPLFSIPIWGVLPWDEIVMGLNLITFLFVLVKLFMMLRSKRNYWEELLYEGLTKGLSYSLLENSFRHYPTKLSALPLEKKIGLLPLDSDKKSLLRNKLNELDAAYNAAKSDDVYISCPQQLWKSVIDQLQKE